MEAGCLITELVTDREAIQHLRDLHIAESKRRYPGLPYHSSPTYRAGKTNDLTKAIKAFLKLKGNHCERTSNEGRMIDHRQLVSDHMGHQRMIGSVTRIKGSGTRGTSDLKAVINGRFVAIEVKNAATRDRLRTEQKAYRDQVEASGGVYVIAESLSGFMNWYYKFISNE